jgi:hypothetical protein
VATGDKVGTVVVVVDVVAVVAGAVVVVVGACSVQADSKEKTSIITNKPKTSFFTIFLSSSFLGITSISV